MCCTNLLAPQLRQSEQFHTIRFHSPLRWTTVMWGKNVLTFKFSKFNKHEKECIIYNGLISKATLELCAYRKHQLPSRQPGALFCRTPPRDLSPMAVLLIPLMAGIITLCTGCLLQLLSQVHHYADS